MAEATKPQKSNGGRRIVKSVSHVPQPAPVPRKRLPQLQASDLRLMRTTDEDAKESFMWLATELGKQTIFHEDSVLAAPLAWFTAVFCHPLSMVFEIGARDGFIAIAKVMPKWRGQIYLAAFTRAGLGNEHVWKTACRAAIKTHDLLILDAFCVESNTAANRMALRCGMTLRGTITEGVWYNGVAQNVRWYTITREELGV